MSLLNVAVSTVYSGCPTADDIHDDAVVPPAAVIFDFNNVPAFAVIHTVLAVLLLLSAFIPAAACVPAVVSGHDIAVILAVARFWRYCCCFLRHCYCSHQNCGR